MGMELRIREPRAEGVAPSRLGVAPSVGLLSPELDWRAGVSSTSLRNCELFIEALGGGGGSVDHRRSLWLECFCFEVWLSLVNFFWRARELQEEPLNFSVRLVPGSLECLIKITTHPYTVCDYQYISVLSNHR
jgi:hypothetical protein